MTGLLLFATLALAQDEAPKPTWYALPTVGFDTDDGFGAGVRAELATHGQGYEPYKTAWVVQGYAAWSGYHHHRLRFDRVGLGPEHRLRLTAHLAWRQWLHDGYWGIGNGTTVADGQDEGTRYQYSLFQPFGHLTLRYDVGEESPWSVFGALSPKYSVVRAFEGSLMEEEQPYGAAGGFSAQVFAGVLYDTRQPEIAPHRGVLLELSGRAAPDLDGEAGGFWGGLASARGFVPLGARVTLASRILVEHLVGEVPFWEMAHWGGAAPIATGSELLRGNSFGRWRAPGKALASAELRMILLRHQAFKRPVEWELAPFVDVGAVYGQGRSAEVLPVHPATGVGIRPIYDGIMVGRLDLAMGAELVEEPGGDVVIEPDYGFYLVFEHPY